MKFTLIIGIILCIIITIFALNNNEYVMINYVFGKFEIAMPLLIFLSIGIGALIAIMFSIPGWWRNRNAINKLKKDNTKLSEELGISRKKILTLQQADSTVQVKPIATTTDEDFMTDVDTEI